MTTAGALVERLYRDYLASGDKQPLRLRLGSALTEDATTVAYDAGMLAADEAELLAPGTVVQFGYEQMLTEAVDEDAAELQVIRGVNGTTATTHEDGELGELGPRFPRQGVFDALADQVVALWPRLYRTVSTTVVAGGKELVQAPEDFVSFIAAELTDWPHSQVKVRPYRAGRMLHLNAADGVLVELTYRTRFPRPSSPWDDLTDPMEGAGLQPGWEQIVLVGTVAQLAAGSPDFDAMAAEYLTDQLTLEAVPPGRGQDIAMRLRRQYDDLVANAARGLVAETPDMVEMVDP